MISSILLWITVVTLAEGNQVTVTTIAGEPYVSDIRESETDFNGFIPDLVKVVFSRLNKEYKIKFVDDGKYGNNDGSGKWNGMIGEILSGKADVAAAPLTTSDERGRVIDFTVPFMEFSTVVVLLKPTDNNNNNSPTLIETVADLAKQTDIKYGAIRGGLTETYFRTSLNDKYRQMYQKMSDEPTLNVNNHSEGIAKVRQSAGKYAFITEGPTADYYVERAPCNLVKVTGDGTNKKTYAWAVKKGSYLKESIDKVLTEMKQNGELDKLQKQWWMSTECSGVEKVVSTFLSILITLIITIDFSRLQ